MMAMTTKSSMSVKALFRVGWAHFRFMVFEIEFGELGLTLYDFSLRGKSRDSRFQVDPMVRELRVWKPQGLCAGTPHDYLDSQR